MRPRAVGEDKVANDAGEGSASAGGEERPPFVHTSSPVPLTGKSEKAAPAAAGGRREGGLGGLESPAGSLKRGRETSPRRGGGREEGFGRDGGRKGEG